MGTYLHVPVQLGIIIISVIDIVLRKESSPLWCLQVPIKQDLGQVLSWAEFPMERF